MLQDRRPRTMTGPEQVALVCVRRGYMIDQTGLVPCQGLDLGYVIAKRPPLSDFALRPTRIFKIDKALEQLALILVAAS